MGKHISLPFMMSCLNGIGCGGFAGGKESDQHTRGLRKGQKDNHTVVECFQVHEFARKKGPPSCSAQRPSREGPFAHLSSNLTPHLCPVEVDVILPSLEEVAKTRAHAVSKDPVVDP